MHFEANRSNDLLTPAPLVMQEGSIALVQKRLLQASFLNLFLVSALGIFLRSFPFLPSLVIEYKNLLHGHSHFAFGGWVLPILLALIMKGFPEVTSQVHYKHWRNIAVLVLASAYGMLLSFPFQGYGLVSIIFSTLSVLATFYMAFVLWRALQNTEAKTAHLFLKAALFFLCISAIGPFATGPLIAMGKAGTPIYYNSVYFYLHFQYNGFFTLTVLALLYKMLEGKQQDQYGKKVYALFTWACIPAYFLSILWNNPHPVFYAIGGLAAVVQLAALGFLLQDACFLLLKTKRINKLLFLALMAFTLKNVLQLFSAFPAVAELAYQHRNFVIAYLHLMLLGFVSLFAFAATFKFYKITVTQTIKTGIYLFLFSFVSTELLLVCFSAGNILAFTIPYYTQLLLFFSLFFMAGLWLLMQNINQQLKYSFQLN
jgi:hypothetical protein